MFPLRILLILLFFSTAPVVENKDEYDYEDGETYTFDELKSYLDSFEEKITQKMKIDLTALESSVRKRLDIEVRRLQRKLAKRTSTQIPRLLEEKVTDLVKDGTLKNFIDNTLLHQVNHLQKGLSSVKAHLRANTVKLTKVKTERESFENYFFTSLKGLKTSRDVEMDEIKAGMSEIRQSTVDLQKDIRTKYTEPMKKHVGIQHSAFMVTLDKHFHASDFPNEPEILIYDTLVTNVGGDYNLKTGKYTAPRDGTYLFSLTVAAHQGEQAGVELHTKTKIGRVWAISVPSWNSASGTFTLHLTQGNTVWIKPLPGALEYYGNDYSTFAGQVLFYD